MLQISKKYHSTIIRIQSKIAYEVSPFFSLCMFDETNQRKDIKLSAWLGPETLLCLILFLFLVLSTKQI